MQQENQSSNGYSRRDSNRNYKQRDEIQSERKNSFKQSNNYKNNFKDQIELEDNFQFKKQFLVLKDISAEEKNEQTKQRELNQISIKSNKKKVELGFINEIDNNLFGEEIYKKWIKSGYQKPTGIQSQTWPIVLQGNNIIGISKTGSGKTLAYMLPILKHIKEQDHFQKVQGPLALVLAPTRELVNQIQKVTEDFCKEIKVNSCQIYGGQAKYIQERHLNQRTDLIIATPGRLIDFMEDQQICLKRVTMIVLDEADRMLDMGFEKELQQIMDNISATWPQQIQNFANKFIKDHIHVQIGNEELTVNKDIKQIIQLIPESEKGNIILQIINNSNQQKVLLFCRTKRRCDELGEYLESEGISCVTLHGDLSQVQRDNSLFKFRTGKTKIMVATDVAARGLDVKDIRAVVNVDLPQNIDDYVHRIGRTGRAGIKGLSISLTSEKDHDFLRDLINFLNDSDQQVPDVLNKLVRLRNSDKRGLTQMINQYFDNNNEVNLENILQDLNKYTQDSQQS